MTTKDKIIDPSNFDLDAFVAGCYQATRYVPIVQDQRKVGEILRLREEYYTALEFNDSSDKDSRILALEETIDGYSELVRAGHLAGGSGTRSRNRTTSSKNP